MSALPPLVPGVAGDASLDDCGCCAGVAPATPVLIYNRPGLAAVYYRPGRYEDFKSSQIARLSAEGSPALGQLRTRDDDDFTIALIDAWSCVCDVLAFYQERHAGEAWLGTATERESIVELGRLIGYRPKPGVAAATDLVFLIDDPPGGTALVDAVEIHAGTRIQSIPGPGETAQTFETGEALKARVTWNGLRTRQTEMRPLLNGSSSTWIEGTTTGLKAGDMIAIIGTPRIEGDPASTQWDARWLTRVEPDPGSGRTLLEWTPALDSHPSTGAQQRLFACRVRASLFGWNAPHPNLLSDAARTRYDFAPESRADWAFTIDETAKQLHLDAIHQGFTPHSWAVLTAPPDVVQLYKVVDAIDDGRAEYAMSGRVTRLTLDTGQGLTGFEGAAYRTVSVYGASEELRRAETPILAPVAGDRIPLDGLARGLQKGRRLVVRGRRAQAVVLADLELTAVSDPMLTAEVAPGTRVTLLAASASTAPGADTFIWQLRTPDGFEGMVTAGPDIVGWVPADGTAETIAEVATLAEVTDDDTYSTLRLERALAAAYDRATAIVHANVASATHGETTHEVLGDGDAGLPFQTMRLKQAPLTHVSARNDTGAASSLRIRVGDVLWHEVPTLYGRGPAERVFETGSAADGSVTVRFGDGRSGARPPTGRNNIVATYRKGIGRQGSVAANRLSTALDRPLGLREVFNPLPAAGGQDPEPLEAARANAPATVLTLGRVVSLRNYEDFARGFAGIAKARADTVWDGEARRIVVTVAGPAGEAVDSSLGDVHDNLVIALRTRGDPFVRITVLSYRPAYFRLAARVLVHPDHLPDVVLGRVEAVLREMYGFERRGFAPPVAASEVIATIHSVEGVRGVDLDRLYRASGPGSTPTLHARLLAQPVTLTAGVLLAAEVLMLDPGPIALEVLT